MRLWAVWLLALASPAWAEVNESAILAPHPPATLAEFGFFDAGGQPVAGVVPEASQT